MAFAESILVPNNNILQRIQTIFVKLYSGLFWTFLSPWIVHPFIHGKIQQFYPAGLGIHCHRPWHLSAAQDPLFRLGERCCKGAGNWCKDDVTNEYKWCNIDVQMKNIKCQNFDPNHEWCYTLFFLYHLTSGSFENFNLGMITMQKDGTTQIPLLAHNGIWRHMRQGKTTFSKMTS